VVATATTAARGGDDTAEKVDREGYRALTEAAEAEGVERFVFVSAQGLGPDSPVALARAKAATEQMLQPSSPDFTILHPVLFMESWIGWVFGGRWSTSPRCR
jgi:NADH dehydrogenase